MGPITLPSVNLMPCAGLANRMRAIASALTYAREVGGTLVIGWKYDQAILEAPFYSLFDLTALPPNVHVIEMGFNVDPNWNRSFEANSPDAWDQFRNANKDSAALSFKSWAAFYKAGLPEWLDALRTLKPLPQLATIVATIMPSAQTIGVHIRRTDHRKATAESPASAFWQAMLRNPALYYYVASDDQAVCKEAARQFPQQVILGPGLRTGLERTSIQGMQNAMIDFLCLSRCERILGSSGSSFGEIAAAYGGIPFFAVHR